MGIKDIDVNLVGFILYQMLVDDGGIKGNFFLWNAYTVAL